ncbi:MAG: pyridoxamine 5'-phosphate oxidase family protein, partial [Acidimicrobiales bacterium]
MANNHRNKIRMSDQEQTAFIEEKKSLQVATLNADGSPHLSTLWFALVDNKIVFETYTRSQKIVNLHRDPRITVLVEDG